MYKSCCLDFGHSSPAAVTLVKKVRKVFYHALISNAKPHDVSSHYTRATFTIHNGPKARNHFESMKSLEKKFY